MTPDATLPAGTDLAVRVRGLRKSYRVGRATVRDAVAGVDLDVARGEILALLGPNGAGKSTTTEVLEGIRHRDAGEVDVLGRDPWQAPLSWRARVGVVLQDTSEPVDLTVAELVHHWTRLSPHPRDADEVIDLVGLTEKARARVPSLSGGQRRRLDVALAVVGRPELLFLDEPTTGFDPAARRAFWDFVEGLREEGTTILLTTHYLDEAARLADRVAVIAGGRLVACDPPETLGGALREESTVTWRDADGLAHAHATRTPTRLVRSLPTGPDGEVTDLQVARLSLEDVYLHLIGGAADDARVADPATPTDDLEEAVR
ncbi:ABC transporter ATP-binding protein [Aquipuribacter nitratireducens]|uniref:ABC transporter ATP-binding protein n=1 Tax=Aquipuribacter nitratireducens TaxID=650104 RepID=A0ABW0GJB9_9MICO